jgi:hypothetical protein
VDATPVNTRFPPDELAKLDTWRKAQPKPLPSRPEAIRRLVELGLSGSPSSRPHSPKALSKSADMAHDALDRQADQTATPEEQARRKRRLVKGPKEFRDMRKDHK